MALRKASSIHRSSSWNITTPVMKLVSRPRPRVVPRGSWEFGVGLRRGIVLAQRIFSSFSFVFFYDFHLHVNSFLKTSKTPKTWKWEFAVWVSVPIMRWLSWERLSWFLCCSWTERVLSSYLSQQTLNFNVQLWNVQKLKNGFDFKQSRISSPWTSNLRHFGFQDFMALSRCVANLEKFHR